jgi:hypothetical protein
MRVDGKPMDEIAVLDRESFWEHMQVTDQCWFAVVFPTNEIVRGLQQGYYGTV